MSSFPNCIQQLTILSDEMLIILICSEEWLDQIHYSMWILESEYPTDKSLWLVGINAQVRQNREIGDKKKRKVVYLSYLTTQMEKFCLLLGMVIKNINT